MTVEENLFELLGIEETASSDEIRKAYLKKSKIHHPDVGGDKLEFEKCNYAYQVLSNKKLRFEYMKTGKVNSTSNVKTDHPAKARKEILNLLFNILSTNEDDSVFSVNVPAMVMNMVEQQNLSNHKKILVLRKEISRLRTYKERFKTKTEMYDFISAGINLEIEMRRSSVEQIIDNMKTLREMRKLLSNYEFQPKTGFDFS